MTAGPPFRADHVGSLLRPAPIRDARAQHADGTLSSERLQEIEDREIARVIARQEELGLKAVTDGEFRRHAWQWDFLKGLDGVTAVTQSAPASSGSNVSRSFVKVTGKIEFTSHPMLLHFAFVKTQTKVMPKMCIPSPTHVVSVLRDWRDVVDNAVYPDLPSMFVDLGASYRKAINAFADAGCRYLQVDDCNLSFLCDPVLRHALMKRGDDPDRMLNDFIALINDALGDRPAGMTVAMHSCRGNARGGFASGGYEAVAEAVFGRIATDAFLLEYDDDRSGGFDPLRYIPKAKRVGLGLVSTKRAAIEPMELLKRRVDTASKHVDIERLFLCPQCGFASTEENHPLTEDEQWRKLEQIIMAAGEFWPGQAL
jgi:5-methyltetrahydropteroyltriglutamate--homocysteine methyltransferase